MKLINKTKCPDNILKALLEEAGLAIGARLGSKDALHGEVVVVVNQGRSYYNRGEARYLNGLVRTKDTGKDWLMMDGGFIRLWLPSPRYVRKLSQSCGVYDAMQFAENMFSTIIHEWGHIFDYQSGMFAQSNSRKYANVQGKSRRTTWAKRPEEIRANAMRTRVFEDYKNGVRKYPTEDILNFAIWFEEENKRLQETKKMGCVCNKCGKVIQVKEKIFTGGYCVSCKIAELRANKKDDSVIVYDSPDDKRGLLVK